MPLRLFFDLIRQLYVVHKSIHIKSALYKVCRCLPARASFFLKYCNIWDGTRRARFRLLDPQGRPRESKAFEEEDPTELDSSYFYGEPDVLEDEVLFPEELSTETTKALYSGKASVLDH